MSSVTSPIVIAAAVIACQTGYAPYVLFNHSCTAPVPSARHCVVVRGTKHWRCNWRKRGETDRDFDARTGPA